MPERYQYTPNNTSSSYTTLTGKETRMTSFRCPESLRMRLFAYAESVDKDPSACIREAIGEYLYKRLERPEVPVKEEVVVEVIQNEKKEPSAEDIWNNILKST